MSRYSDNSGVSHTCPKIDEVIEFLNKIDWDLDDEYESNLAYETTKMIEVMEEIRTANSTLRDWGNDMCRERDEVQKDLEYYQSKNEDLEDEVKELREEVEELEERVTDLEEELVNIVIPE